MRLTLVRWSLGCDVGETDREPLTVLLLKDIGPQRRTSNGGRRLLNRRHLNNRYIRGEDADLFNCRLSLTVAGRGRVNGSKILPNRLFAFIPLAPNIYVIDVFRIDGDHFVYVMRVPTPHKIERAHFGSLVLLRSESVRQHKSRQ